MMGHLGFFLFTAGTLVASPVSNPCALFPLVTEPLTNREEEKLYIWVQNVEEK